jgi:hypothetical protein
VAASNASGAHAHDGASAAGRSRGGTRPDDLAGAFAHELRVHTCLVQMPRHRLRCTPPAAAQQLLRSFPRRLKTDPLAPMSTSSGCLDQGAGCGRRACRATRSRSALRSSASQVAPSLADAKPIGRGGDRYPDLDRRGWIGSVGSPALISSPSSRSLGAWPSARRVVAPRARTLGVTVSPQCLAPPPDEPRNRTGAAPRRGWSASRRARRTSRLRAAPSWSVSTTSFSLRSGAVPLRIADVGFARVDRASGL